MAALSYPGRISSLTIINIAGLSAGLAGVILIALWVSFELSYDRSYANADRIYRVESLLDFTGKPFIWTVTPGPAYSSLKADFPEVENSVMMKSGYHDAVSYDGVVTQASNLYYSTPEFFEIFSIPLLSGEGSEALSNPGSIIISERISVKLFGNADPLGNILMLNNEDEVVVTGVMSDSPVNSHLQVDYLLPFRMLEQKGLYSDSWGTFNYMLYVLLYPESDASELNSKLEGYLQSKKDGSGGRLLLNPLRRIYLHRDPGFESPLYPSESEGPIASVKLFSLIGLVLLIISCINFLNLTTASATNRIVETGIRKVNGASRRDIIKKVLAEIYLQIAAAVLLAIILTALALPYYNNLTGMELRVEMLFKPLYIIIYVILIFIAGLFSGLYPALYISSFSPVTILKPGPLLKFSGNSFRKVLVMIQFSLSMIFIISLLTINKQLRFMERADPGFNREDVMVIYPARGGSSSKHLKDQIAGAPGVSMTAMGSNVPVNMGNWMTLSQWEGNIEDKAIRFYNMEVDDNYFDLLGFRITEGRNFDSGPEEWSVIINETAVMDMEMSDPVNKTIIKGGKSYRIIGIVRDFNFDSMKERPQPVFITKPEKLSSEIIFVQFSSGHDRTTIENVLRIAGDFYPGFPVNYFFLDEEIKLYYSDESRLVTLIGAATLLCLIIAGTGLFSLTTFSLNRKRRSLSIHKINGATGFAIFVLLQKEFGRAVMISSLIGILCSITIVRSWLQLYAYHITLGPRLFLLGLILLSAVYIVSVAYYSISAATCNPVESLKEG